jgi:hypothetical protein
MDEGRILRAMWSNPAAVNVAEEPKGAETAKRTLREPLSGPHLSSSGPVARVLLLGQEQVRGLALGAMKVGLAQ